MTGSILDALADAAARGVAVTIVTNGGPAPTLRLRWAFQEKYWGATGDTRAAGYTLHVIDRDGDCSAWTLKRGRQTIADGEIWKARPYYHFDACLLAAEAALFAEVARRRAEIIVRRGGRP